ncbi:hypothetical protein [Olsenella uli]|uniref:hypothetical protein n=1 Tax=Olsenella uli TaxID=133926 RepID=UPI0012ABC222|nr:hypothetical protein [Olsenella uli]
MERAFTLVAIVAFVAGATLLVASAVVFVRLNVADAIRFLRGRRHGARPERSRRLHPASRARYGEVHGRATALPTACATAPSGPAMRAVVSGAANDAPTTVVGADMSSDDCPTSVVALLEQMARAATEKPQASEADEAEEADAEVSAGDEKSEQLADESEGAGAVAEDEAERPTAALASDEGDSERQTESLGAPTDESAGGEPAGTKPETEQNHAIAQKVAQHEGVDFRFTLKQDVVVAHVQGARGRG